MTTPFLSDLEIADFCDPLTQPAAQVRYLRRQGLEVKVKPNGRPLVSRSLVDSILRGAVDAASVLAKDSKASPDFAGLMSFLDTKPNPNNKQASKNGNRH